MSAERKYRGTVKLFNDRMGWGFITPDGPIDRAVFLHYTAIVGEGYRTLKAGQRVEYTVEPSEKGPRAVTVVPLDDGPYAPDAQGAA